MYIYVPTDSDDIGAALQAVALLGRYAAEYTNDNHQTPVWFYRKINDETNGTRTLVRSIRFIADARFHGYFDHPPASCAGRTGVLTITHHPYNERTTAVAASGTGGVSVIGGAVNYTDVTGDVAARLSYLNIDNIAFARTYRRVWAGFRSDRRAGGDAGNVASLWEIEDGTPNVVTDTSIVAGDATASPGGAGNTKMQCDFATHTDWESRLTLGMSDVTANYGNQVGAYVVLMRAKVDANAAQVKLRQVGQTLTVYRENQVVDIDATNWTLYNLGTCEWPTRNLHATPTALFAASYDQRDGFQIYARVKPGGAAPTLDMDCLILIPADEYLIQAQSTEASHSAITDSQIYITVAPEDAGACQTVDSVGNYFKAHSPVSIIGSGVPAGDGRLFIAVVNANDGTAPAFSDTVDVELSPTPRWVHFRGGD